MRRLNRAAAETLTVLGTAVHAVTDVTGYGLAGHAWEMAERTGAATIIETSTLVAYPGARRIADAGHRTGGDQRNRDYLGWPPRLDRRRRAPRPCASTRRRPAVCWPRSIPAADDLLGAGWWRVGEVATGEPPALLRAMVA